MWAWRNAPATAAAADIDPLYCVENNDSIAMLLTDAEWEALYLSLAVALRSVAMSLPVALLTAWLLARRRLGR